MNEKETINVVTANNKNTCKKCVYGVIINPDLGYCAKYRNKPDEILYEGKECPFMKAYKFGE